MIGAFVVLCLLYCAFYLMFLYFSRRLQHKRPHVNAPEIDMTREERATLFRRCLDSIQDFRSYIEGWFFYRVRFEEIRSDNLKEFLAWAFFGEDLDVMRRKSESELDARVHLVEIDEMFGQMERHFGVRVPQGKNANAKCIRLNLDPVMPTHKPFVYYLALWTLNAIFSLYFRALGFRRFYSHAEQQSLLGLALKPLEVLQPHMKRCQTRIPYWYRPGRPDPKSGHQKAPFVFVHGIGVGLFGYAISFTRLVLSTDAPLFMIEMPNVLSRLFPVQHRLLEDVPTHVEMVGAVENMLKQHGYAGQKATFAGHSLGSTVLTWLLKLSPHLVKRCIFLDPVCFLLHYPDVAYNFIHRVPRDAVQLLLSFFISRELYISWTLGRCFHWNHNVLFAEDIPENVKVDVILGGVDAVVNSPSVRDYLLLNAVQTGIKPRELVVNSRHDFKVLRHEHGKSMNLYYYPTKNHAHYIFDYFMDGNIIDIFTYDTTPATPQLPETRKPARQRNISVHTVLGKTNFVDEYEQMVDTVIGKFRIFPLRSTWYTKGRVLSLAGEVH